MKFTVFIDLFRCPTLVKSRLLANIPQSRKHSAVARYPADLIIASRRKFVSLTSKEPCEILNSL